MAKLPQGIDTILSKEFGGVDLSGGQWQRIALARAFFRKSPIVILDEPTAALDPVAEEEIYRRFVELKEGRTVILVSHRLSAARLADRVALMVDGSIRECGRHEELMALDGEYPRLFKLQAGKYRL
ncbi:MAG TPA: ABC transporter ATP-binding protein [Firmicutes bacterium]|nr:ABC transporter ATP-binding protein [Bacillota bacterium]